MENNEFNSATNCLILPQPWVALLCIISLVPFRVGIELMKGSSSIWVKSPAGPSPMSADGGLAGTSLRRRRPPRRATAGAGVPWLTIHGGQVADDVGWWCAAVAVGSVAAGGGVGVYHRLQKRRRPLEEAHGEVLLAEGMRVPPQKLQKGQVGDGALRSHSTADGKVICHEAPETWEQVITQPAKSVGWVRISLVALRLASK